jgi:dihydroorotate dehydrogenase (NAD+) catalytic subunit
MVWQVSQAVKIPIIGMGGISSWQDAVEFILAGADAVSIGTANFVNPYAPLEILKGLEQYLAKNKFSSIHELKGNIEYYSR